MNETIEEIAHKRADRIAPPPQYDPIQAGLCGAFFSSIVLGLFMAVARLRPEGFETEMAVSILAGFLIPFGYLKYCENRNSKAFWREYDELTRQQNVNSPEVPEA